jgi:DNA repair protein RadA/Sms
MAKAKPVFECQACGNQQSKWLGKCPQCGAWDSFIELSQQEIKISKEIAKSTGVASKVLMLNRWQDKFTSTQALA